MSEINGRPVAVGDTILVQTQVATIARYDELADKMVYVLGEGNGTNSVECHISNTSFRVIDLSQPVGLAHEQHDNLQTALSEVQTIAAPVEEDPDTDRVKGDVGAKMPGQPGVDNGEQIITAG